MNTDNQCSIAVAGCECVCILWSRVGIVKRRCVVARTLLHSFSAVEKSEEETEEIRVGEGGYQRESRGSQPPAGLWTSCRAVPCQETKERAGWRELQKEGRIEEGE